MRKIRKNELFFKTNIPVWGPSISIIQEQAREVSLLLKGRTLTATLTEDIFANRWFLLCTEKEKRKNNAFLVEKALNLKIHM